MEIIIGFLIITYNLFSIYKLEANFHKRKYKMNQEYIKWENTLWNA